MLKTQVDIKEYLEAERARVKAKIEELSRTDCHMAHFDQGQNRTLRMSLEGLLTQIEKGLLSLETGTYGVCEGCGEPIDPERMEALPHATMCVPCKGSQERIRTGKNQSIEVGTFSVKAAEVS